MNKLKLLDLPYQIDYLEPAISSQQLSIHHDKHHANYVAKANELMEQLAESDERPGLDFGGVYKKLAFNVSGDYLHNLYWESLGKEGTVTSEIEKILATGFKNFRAFVSQMKQTALSIEGSGWAALSYNGTNQSLTLLQIQNHSLNIIPEARILLVLDMWEHAYYLDYKNDKEKYFDNAFNIINWQKVLERYKAVMAVESV